MFISIGIFSVLRMSLNTSHAANRGVLIHSSEVILLFIENITIEFSEQSGFVFHGAKHGSIYLTTHRMIFIAKNFNDEMKSFSFPFVYLDEVHFEQSILSVSSVDGVVKAHPLGNFIGDAKFKLMIRSGGVNEVAEALLHAISLAQENARTDAPRIFTRSSDDWNQASESVYTSIPANYEWLPRTMFPERPIAGTIFICDSFPPYAGIVPNDPPPSYDDQYLQTPPQPLQIAPTDEQTTQTIFPRSNYPQSSWEAIYNEVTRLSSNIHRTIRDTFYSSDSPQTSEIESDTPSDQRNPDNLPPPYSNDNDQPPSYESIYTRKFD